MRRFWTILGLAGLALGSASALEGQGIAFGAKAGVDIADVSSDEFGFGGVQSRTAALGGVFLTVMGSRSFGLQAEALYARRGFGALVVGGTAVAKMDYLEVPILVRYRLVPQDRRVRPVLYSGLFLAAEAACSLSGDLEGIGGTSDCDSLMAGRGTLDGGLTFGGAVDIGLSSRYFLQLDGRYNLGLLNLVWEDEADRVNTRVWAFSAGVGVLLGS